MRKEEDGAKRESDSCSVSEGCHGFIARWGRRGRGRGGRGGSSAPGSADSCLVGVITEDGCTPPTALRSVTQCDQYIKINKYIKITKTSHG